MSSNPNIANLSVYFPVEARHIVREMAYELNTSPSRILRNIVCSELVKHAKTKKQRESLLSAIKPLANSE